MAMPRQLLICSLGNPPPLLTTRHSAAHLLLTALSTALSFPRLTLGTSTTCPHKPNYTLFQSPVQMNVSGPPICKAWRGFLRKLPAQQEQDARLIIVHDELEKELGVVKLKRGGSPGGHNGLKSIIDSLQTKDFIRIGIGIGRPESRQPKAVADYVLGRMTSLEKESVEGCVGEVVRILHEIEMKG